MTPAKKKYFKQYRKRNKARLDAQQRDLYYRRVYGLSFYELQALWLEQDKLCACCDEPLLLPSRSTHLDHCHKTGKIRGLLCGSCNRMLGAAKDQLFNLRRGVSYLRFHGVKL